MRHLLLLLLCLSCAHVSSVPCGGTDFHMHIHSPGEVADDLVFTGERALFAADSIGLERAIALSNAYSQQVTRAYAQRENDFALAEARRYPERLVAAVSVNPAAPWATEEMKRCLEARAKVLKLHLMASGLDLKRETDRKIVDAFLANLPAGLTILIHANYPTARRGNEAARLVDLINQHPQFRWIVGHMLGQEFRLLADLKAPRVFVEVSAAVVWAKTVSEREALAQTIRDFGITHVLFGSDWPVLHPAETLKALQALPLTAEEILRIKHSNAVQFDDLFQ